MSKSNNKRSVILFWLEFYLTFFLKEILESNFDLILSFWNSFEEALNMVLLILHVWHFALLFSPPAASASVFLKEKWINIVYKISMMLNDFCTNIISAVYRKQTGFSRIDEIAGDLCINILWHKWYYEWANTIWWR